MTLTSVHQVPLLASDEELYMESEDDKCASASALICPHIEMKERVIMLDGSFVEPLTK
jgi:hypothetical protein